MDQLATARIDLVTVSVMGVIFMLVMLFWGATKRGLSCLDLITDKGSGKMSLAKVMNLVGVIVGSWVVMRMAIDKSLDAMVFFGFLMYCASVHGFSTWLSAKYRPGEPKAPTSP